MRRAPLGARGEHRDAGERIGEAIELDGVLARERGEAGVDRGAADRLVRQEHARDAEAAADGELLHGRDRDRPGAGRDLQGEELRRHRGLAVRRDLAARSPGRRRVIQALLASRRSRRSTAAGSGRSPASRFQPLAPTSPSRRSPAPPARP